MLVAFSAPSRCSVHSYVTPAASGAVVGTREGVGGGKRTSGDSASPGPDTELGVPMAVDPLPSVLTF